MTSKQEAILNSSVPKSTPYETGWGQPLKGENKEKADDAVRCKYVLFDTLHKLWFENFLMPTDIFINQYFKQDFRIRYFIVGMFLFVLGIF